jgi:ATP/ADP translocase
MAEVKPGRVAFVMLLFVLVAVWVPSMRVFALGAAVLLALFLLFSAAMWIHRLRHPEADEMDEQTEILQDLREAALWLFKLWP